MASAREVLERLRAQISVSRHGAAMGGERDYICGLIDERMASELAALPEEPAEQPAPRASIALIKAVENCLARGYNRPLDDVLDSAASVFEIPPGEWVALLEALAAERSRPADDRDATIAELRERLRVAERDLVIEKADREDAEAKLASESACHQTKVQAMAWDYAQQVRANEDLRMVAERAEKAEAEVSRMVRAASHDYAGQEAKDIIAERDKDIAELREQLAAANAAAAEMDAKNAALRDELANHDAMLSADPAPDSDAKPDPAGDERCGSWTLRNYLHYGPCLSRLEQAVAELCRRALREEADRG